MLESHACTIAKILKRELCGRYRGALEATALECDIFMILIFAINGGRGGDRLKAHTMHRFSGSTNDVITDELSKIWS